jgi:hypothetical protein
MRKTCKRPPFPWAQLLCWLLNHRQIAWGQEDAAVIFTCTRCWQWVSAGSQGEKAAP